ncbi:uncharacterized protein F4817DRAFT_313858 [Daldinia loculata]|uniref:uncharacterized protein n=1 Tax=Daldinia loculata TaxID=103429 RepID=UPI0020C444C7|nr:uncharacterized protein F4817DRAFT_313858 [Daldinia loculata]KAI1649306.1 hypothetical protein F4817DRAFT_313858 [Daldinia loculata]
MALPIATIVDIVSMSLSFLITAMTAWEFYRRRTRKHRKSACNNTGNLQSVLSRMDLRCEAKILALKAMKATISSSYQDSVVD